MYRANPSMEIPYNEYNQEELAYYLLSERVEAKFPEGAPTIRVLYSEVGRPLGLSRFDFNNVVRRSVDAGYLVKEK